MDIEVKMDMREIRDYLNREVQKHLERVVAMLQYVGEKVVSEIRASYISNWNDQTGNLRSSIGYIVAIDGKPVGISNFSRILGPNNDEWKVVKNGSEEGRAYARQLINLYPEGIALIVVAGMEYASYVEKRDNKTVLAQGEIRAQTLISQMIQQLNAKLNDSK